VYAAQQGGPLQHVVAGKPVARRIAGSDAFRDRHRRTVAGARAVAGELLSAGWGVDVLTGGTDVHLVMCDLRNSPLNGKEAEDRLVAVGITVSRSAVPFDPRPPVATSGVRIGSAALATRGLQVEDFAQVGAIIAEALQPDGFEGRRVELAERPRYRRASPALRPDRRGRNHLSAMDRTCRCRLRFAVLAIVVHARRADTTRRPKRR
jgi:glycine hydroxymethyltransferase